MKRVGFLFDKLLDKEYIKNIIIYASKNKTDRKEVQVVLKNIDNYVELVYLMIKENNIKLKPVKHYIINERGKERKITKSPFFPNQIFDYLLTETLKPVIRKSLYFYSVGNIDGKGIVYGKKAIEKKIKKYKYYLKLDIHHFYESVQTDLLIKKLEKKIKDKRFIGFAKQIISEECLPIGCYYSQWLSNYFLNELDHFVKEQLHIPFYVRYVDDMLLVSNNKRQLAMSQIEIKRFLETLKLELKRKEIVKKIDKLHPISFLGFKFYLDHTYLRNKIFKRLNHTVAKCGKHVNNSLIKRMISYLGWLKQIDYGYGYYKNNIEPIIKIGYIRYRASLMSLKR